jgi:hypothetical protein
MDIKIQNTVWCAKGKEGKDSIVIITSFIGVNEKLLNKMFQTGGIPHSSGSGKKATPRM